MFALNAKRNHFTRKQLMVRVAVLSILRVSLAQRNV